MRLGVKLALAQASVWTIAIASACARTDAPAEHFARSGGGARSSGRDAGIGGTESALGGAPTEVVGGSATSGAPTATDGGEAPHAGSNSGPETRDDYGCGDAPTSTGPFTRRALRRAAAECAQWHYCRFEGIATQLEASVASWASDPKTETLAGARARFATALGSWSEIELMQFGPLASSATSAGKDTVQGKGLRELIYAWPQTVRCRVEEQVVNRSYLGGMDGVLTSARGLFGLDYLLHFPGNDSACAPASAAGKKWSMLEESTIAQGKRDYAMALAQDVLARIGMVREAWAPSGGNFAPLFVDANGYASEDQAMTILAWSLLYLEREVKDWKLGVPAGFTSTSPVTLPEAPFSGLGTLALRGNLRGFRSLFAGCGPDGEGLGVDDWLTEAGHEDLASDIARAWRRAHEFAEAFPPLSQAKPTELEAFYRSVKSLTDLLKNDLFGAGSPLGLDLPDGIASDTD